MPRIRCPYCGAEFEAPAGFSHVVCPYCGTVIETASGRRSEAWIYPVRLEEHDAYAAALSRASQLPGAPDDIEEAAVYRGGELHYVPLHVCRAWARAVGCEGAGEEVEAAEPAAAVHWVPGWYRFPAVGRAPFDPRQARRGVFHQVERGSEQLCRGLEARVKKETVLEALAMGCGPSLEAGSSYLGLAHYPFWLIRYSHPSGDRVYLAAVDAVDATVVYLEYPIPGSKRARLAGYAAAALAAGLAAAGGVAAAVHSLYPLVGSAASLAAALPFLRRAVARLGRYTPRKPRVLDAVIKEAPMPGSGGEKTPAPASPQPGP